jgi:hypothetical protein
MRQEATMARREVSADTGAAAVAGAGAAAPKQRPRRAREAAPSRDAATRNLEIWYALLAIAVITGLYTLAYLQRHAFPAASSLIGHGIGVAGFLLMLGTATLYPLRKRVMDSRWGSMGAWLKYHMVAGLVGPYMVLLHTAMRFHGLAAVAMGLTVVVVLSGVVGRYIYTRAARAVAGELLVASGPEAQRRRAALASRRRSLATWHSIHVPLTWALFVAAFIHVFAALFYATLQR